MSKKLDNSTNSLNMLLGIVTKNIQSDHYAARVYRKLSDENLTEDQLISVLKSISSIQSDHSMSQALMAFASNVKGASERVKTAYRTTAKSMGSDHYYGRAVKAID